MNTPDQGVFFQCVVLTCFLVYPPVNSQSACGGTLMSLAGAIQSPNFPNSYTNGLSCIYVIKPNSKGVTLTFTSFDLEHESACGYDYVEVRAGDSESSPKLGRYCGTSLPGPLRTSGNRMWVKFVTDGNVTRRGFKAIYTPACGATLTSLTGVIKSPNFPNDYTDGLGCVYVINVPDISYVTLTFTTFDLEDATGCQYDYVEVRDGDSESSPRLGRYCGTSLPGPLRASNNRMWIKFVTDSSVTRPGFRATYTSACRSTLTSLTGVIHSPNFPNNYPNGLGCVYVISVPDTYRVTLTFTNFDVENSTGCKYDYVEVRAGNSESSPRLGRYCGTSLPGLLRVSNNRMWIKFVTDGSVTRPGFRATYTSACGETLTSLAGVIKSPNFPNNYINGVNCVYVITAPHNYRVTLTFTAFNLEAASDCRYDYVEIRNGHSGSSPLFGRFCNTSLPGPFRTSSNWMWVKFVTDSSATRTGFRATYTSDNGCFSAPCQNGATCTDHVNGYLCHCAPGYSGLHCQTDIDECVSAPCQNGGTCTDHVNGYLCQCAPGYSGLHCQTDIDECVSAPCQNGGTCTDHVNSYLCQCAPGYSGLQCQTDIDECASGPCQNGGTCTDDVNSYTCLCAPGYSGIICNKGTGQSALNVPLIGGAAAGVSVVVVVVVIIVIFAFMKRRDPQHDKPGKRQNRTSKEPHIDPRTENNQPGETNRACSVSSISGDTLYCKLEKKKKHPEESPYTALGAPCKQAVFTNQAFNENADPDHVYANAAHENGGHDNNDNSSVYDNLKSEPHDDYLRPPTIPPRKPPTITPRRL